MRRLRNPVRGYAWGSREVIASLQGRPVPSPGPEAELWVGAHPADSSLLEPDGQPLAERIAAAPRGVLGGDVVDRFGARLPYLLKLLAADAPLSLQAHPDPKQAAAGFAAEEAAGVPRGAAHRRYVDKYHKPELLVAVSEFRALCGFRDPAASAELLAELGVPALEPAVAALRADNLAGAVRWLLESAEPAVVVPAVVTAAAAAGERHRLVGELAAAYPGDIGVVVALLLNEVALAPGEAIYMPAGNLHAYLRGTGVEIMAASDNVLRGGLTPKHVDVPELLRVLRCVPLRDPVCRPVADRPGVVSWPVPASEFALYRVRPQDAGGVVDLDLSGPRIGLCLAGRVELRDAVGALTLAPGEAGFAEAESAPGADGSGSGLRITGAGLRISGAGEVFVASVGALQEPRPSI